jgi:hypothetical protein
VFVSVDDQRRENGIRAIFSSALRRFVWRENIVCEINSNMRLVVLTLLILDQCFGTLGVEVYCIGTYVSVIFFAAIFGFSQSLLSYV